LTLWWGTTNWVAEKIFLHRFSLLAISSDVLDNEKKMKAV
jgi:hypothetical protein